jgi:hypothetical protein
MVVRGCDALEMAGADDAKEGANDFDNYATMYKANGHMKVAARSCGDGKAAALQERTADDSPTLPRGPLCRGWAAGASLVGRGGCLCPAQPPSQPHAPFCFGTMCKPDRPI